MHVDCNLTGRSTYMNVVILLCFKIKNERLGSFLCVVTQLAVFSGHPHTGQTGGYGSLHREETPAIHWRINSSDVLNFSHTDVSAQMHTA